MAEPDPHELEPAAMRAGSTRYPAVYDSVLGYVPEASSVHPGLWGVTVTLNEHGVRDNGNPPQPGPWVAAE